MKKDIFEDASEDEGRDELTVNKKYAAQYAKRKTQEKEKEKYLSSSGSESSSEDEDSDAELLTEMVESKIVETIAKIKSKDPSIYAATETSIFAEEDFQRISERQAAARPGQKVTYKDVVRETLLTQGAEAFEAEAFEDGRRRRLKPQVQLEREARAAFRDAAAQASDAEEEQDDGLTVKKKAEPLSKEQSIERAKKMGSSSAWSSLWEQTSDENELFLRDFIVNERWKERESLQTATRKTKTRRGEETAAAAISDSEDERDLEKTEEFEREYNFRFEEEGGTRITGHARRVEDSVRLKDDTRKRKREELKTKKEELKRNKEEELKRLKNLKMQELNRRLEQIAEATGNKKISADKVGVLDTEFDPEEHDRQVEQLIGDDYYEQNDDKYDQDEHLGVQEAEYEGGAGAGAENEWFLCDGCEKPIPPGKRMYECTSCPDFVVCGNCQRKIEHPHKLHRETVPEHCVPPADWDKVEAEKEKAMDEVFALDFEDVIAGGIATRFKYKKVEKQDFGLTAEDLLNKPDSYLNKKVSLKKIHPYRTQ